MAANVGTVNVTLLISRCKTCRWWGNEIAPDYRECFKDMRLCDCPKPGMTGVDHDQMEDEIGGEVATHRDFGCVHWEERK